MNLILTALFICVSLLPVVPVRAQRSTPCCEKVPVFKAYDAVWGKGSLGVWLGADAAYSVVLKESAPEGNITNDLASDISSAIGGKIGEKKVLWVFGDTFIGARGAKSRVGAKMVGNTIGIADCSGNITYNWRGVSPNSSAFFPDPGPDVRYWPNQPFMAGRILYVPLLVVNKTYTGLGFMISETRIAVINNALDAPPNKWRIRILPLLKVKDMSGATAAVVKGKYVYLFNALHNDVNLARLPMQALSKSPSGVRPYLEYLNKTNEWVSGFDAGKAKYLGLHMNSGGTLGFNSTRGFWTATYAESSSYPFKNISMASAMDLAGPWSEPRAVFTLPRHGTVVCYAGYGHRVYSSRPDEQLSVTYNCNDTKWGQLLRNMGVYFPRWTTLSLNSSPTPPAFEDAIFAPPDFKDVIFALPAPAAAVKTETPAKVEVTGAAAVQNKTGLAVQVPAIMLNEYLSPAAGNKAAPAAAVKTETPAKAEVNFYGGQKQAVSGAQASPLKK